MSQTGTEGTVKEKKAAKGVKSSVVATQSPEQNGTNETSDLLEVQSPVSPELVKSIVAQLKPAQPSKEARVIVMGTIASAYLNADLYQQHLNGNEVNHAEIIEESILLTNLIFESVYGPVSEQIAS